MKKWQVLPLPTWGDSNVQTGRATFSSAQTLQLCEFQNALVGTHNCKGWGHNLLRDLVCQPVVSNVLHETNHVTVRNVSTRIGDKDWCKMQFWCSKLHSRLVQCPFQILLTPRLQYLCFSVKMYKRLLLSVVIGAQIGLACYYNCQRRHQEPPCAL